MELCLIAGSAEWELVFDTNGFGCTQDKASKENPQLLEDLFSMQVHNHQEHGLVIRTDTQAAMGVDLLSRFEPLKMSVTFGTNKKTSELNCCKLHWPRAPAATILISLKDVYTALGLNQYGGKRWRWINSGIGAWFAWMKDAGYAAHLVPSHAQNKACVSELVEQHVSNSVQACSEYESQ